MKLNDEKKEVFKDPSPIQSLGDVGRVIGYGAAGFAAGAAAGVGTAFWAGAFSGAFTGSEGALQRFLIGGAVIGGVTGAASGVLYAINKCGFDKLVDKAREIASAPGFDQSILDSPIKGFMTGELYRGSAPKKTGALGHGAAFLMGGNVGLAASVVLDHLDEGNQQAFAKDPSGWARKQRDGWYGKEVYAEGNKFISRHENFTTLRDILELKASKVGKPILREFIETGRIDSFLRFQRNAAIDAGAPERLAGFMKSTLATDASAPAPKKRGYPSSLG